MGFPKKNAATAKATPATNFKELMRQVTGASAAGTGKFITQDGQYALAITKIWFKDGHKGKSVIVTFVVAASRKNGAEEPHSIGEKVCTVFKPFEAGKNAEYFAGLYKAFLLALGGFDEDTVDEEELNDFGSGIIDDSNPMHGKLIEGVAFKKPKADGEIITAVTWGHMPETDEEVAANSAGIKDGTWPEVA